VWIRPSDAAELSATRRNLIRATRPRWLGGGTAGGEEVPAARWDAFFAPPGGPLADMVAPAAALSWTEARPILEELTDELSAARNDGTLPATLSLDQVWVQPDGRAHLLDFPPGESPTSAGEPEALALVRQTAILALEGAPRPPGHAPKHIRAVVPRHAGKLLDRLLDVGEPFRNLDELHAALHDTHDRPTETTRSIRVAHLGVQGTLLAVGLLWIFIASGLFGVLDLLVVRIQVNEGEAALRVARDPNADADLRRHFASLDPDGTLADRVTAQLIADRNHLLHRANQANRPERLVFESLEQVIPWDEDIERRDLTEVAVRVGAPVGDQRPPVRGWVYRFRELFEIYSAAIFLLLAAAPAAWVVWSFLTRGGLTLRLMGLALVRADGRKAARWQCAWRSLLVWSPVVALLWACILAKTYVPQFYFVQSGLWWLAVALVLAYLVLAIRRPSRTLHDRLAGTYLVPL